MRNVNAGNKNSISWRHITVWTAPTITTARTTLANCLVSLDIKPREPANSMIPVTVLYVTGVGW